MGVSRRELIGIAALGVAQTCAGMSNANAMSDGPPEKIHLIPDQWHIHYVGRLKDGRHFWVDGQVTFDKRGTKDYVCTFLFDGDGRLTTHNIELVGQRGAYPDARFEEVRDRHLAVLGAHTIRDVWIRLFSVNSNGHVFGLIPRRLDDGRWYVEFMPGNTLAFYPPWEAGGYDT